MLRYFWFANWFKLLVLIQVYVSTNRKAVRDRWPTLRDYFETYERNANRVDLVAQEFIRDLNDIITMTNWAEKEGATKMTLEVNW